MTVLKKTALNLLHREASARMVDFGGWDMPVHYGSQIEEHHAVRRDAGMFDVSHMVVLDLKGDGARAFLRYALANDVEKLKTPGRALYSCLLRDDGHVLDDLIVYFIDESFFRIVVNAGTADKDVAWFEQLRDKHAPTLTLRRRDDLGILAVQGQSARDRVWQVLPEIKPATAGLNPFSAITVATFFIARTGYTGEDGFEIIAPHEAIVVLWQQLRAVGVRPCGLGARDTLRLEAGMNLYGQDMDETVSPLESGLAWTVDFKDASRNFVGKAALLAHPPARHLVGLLLLDSGGVLRAHQAVHTGHGDGEITSGTFSPTLTRAIALARVPDAVQEDDTVFVAVRDKQLKARVVKPPFAKQGKVLIDV
ncbi:MAG: glycine cleavage system aminomethyltransferase GcvT [Burkholderiales bacterium]|nr:glycine cleavage system aminomethyltransferase GcvT [Burkholderiales bacterium]